jgi:hypothetical protein
MDFDDLDDQDPVVLTNQKPKGVVLDPIKRTKQTPTDQMLDERVQTRLPAAKERQPKIRLLITMGAADNVSQEWVFMAHDAPEDIEVIAHEPPGHGTRAKEDICTTLQGLGDDALEGFREAMDTGAFVLLGHSIGCLTAVYVAERARRELNVEPELVIMIERGAAHIPAFSDYGYELLKKDPLLFMQIRDPSTAKGCAMQNEVGKQALKMWGSDLLLENDTREVGFHKFACPLKCYRCPVFPFKQCSEETMKNSEEHIKIHNLTKDYLGHFGPREFEEWNSWTDHPDGAPTVVVEESNHMTIKSHQATRQDIWKHIKEVMRSWDSKNFES